MWTVTGYICSKLFCLRVRFICTASSLVCYKTTKFNHLLFTRDALRNRRKFMFPIFVTVCLVSISFSDDKQGWICLYIYLFSCIVLFIYCTLLFRKQQFYFLLHKKYYRAVDHRYNSSRNRHTLCIVQELCNDYKYHIYPNYLILPKYHFYSK